MIQCSDSLSFLAEVLGSQSLWETGERHGNRYSCSGCPSTCLFFYLETVPSSAEDRVPFLAQQDSLLLCPGEQDRDTPDTLGRTLIFEGDFKGTESCNSTVVSVQQQWAWHTVASSKVVAARAGLGSALLSWSAAWADCPALHSEPNTF